MSALSITEWVPNSSLAYVSQSLPAIPDGRISLILCVVAHKMRYVKAALMLYRKDKPLNLNPFFSIDST